MLINRSDRSVFLSNFPDHFPGFTDCSHKKIPAVQGIFLAGPSCIECFPLFLIGELSFHAGFQTERTLFLRNSNKFPATDVCLHVMSYSAGSFRFISATVRNQTALIFSGNNAFQHALRGPFFVSAYRPALTCPDSLWVPLTFYFRINGLFYYSI